MSSEHVGTSNMGSNGTELRRMSSSTPTPTTTLGWPADVDLDVWYDAERQQVDGIIRSAMDLSVWSLEAKREHVSVFLHCKNNEKLSYSVRAVAKVAGSVSSVMECLRTTESQPFRTFQKLLHTKSFADGEVLHAHQRHNPEAESLSLKWLTFWAQKTLGKGKEVCVREYCTTVARPNGGAVGVCSFESYDGLGARYGIRSKPDAYSLTVLEPSAYVVQPTAEDNIVAVTLTLTMRKARGEGVSSGVKLLAMRLALDLGALQRAMQHLLFQCQPGALADKKEWVRDRARANCSLCVQSFGLIKRRHHCRVCGEVVCSTCTVFKQVGSSGGASEAESSAGGAASATRVRVCKACLAKASTAIDSVGGGGATTTAGTSSDGSRSSNDDAAPIAPLQIPAAAYQFAQSTTAQSPYNNSNSNGNGMYHASAAPHGYAKSNTSFSDVDAANPAAWSSSDSPPRMLLHPTLHKSLSTPVTSTSSARGSAAPSFMSSASTVSSTSSHGSHSSYNSSSRSLRSSTEMRRISYFNEDFEEICLLAMETLGCPMAGIRTDDFELVRYYDGNAPAALPRSLPTFRRIASRGKPCIVLDVSADKRISGDKRFTAKLQFFVGIPLVLDGDVIGDLCVADRVARDTIDFKQVEVLNVLGTTVTQYMQSHDYMEDLAMFKAMRRHSPPGAGSSSGYPPPGAGSSSGYPPPGAGSSSGYPPPGAGSSSGYPPRNDVGQVKEVAF